MLSHPPTLEELTELHCPMSAKEALAEYKELRSNSKKHGYRSTLDCSVKVFRVRSKISGHHWAISASSNSAALTYGLSLLYLEGHSITWPKQKSRYLSSRTAPDLAYLLPDADSSSGSKYQLLACLRPSGEPSEHEWQRACEIYGQYITIPVGSSAPSHISPIIQRQRRADLVRRCLDHGQ